MQSEPTIDDLVAELRAYAAADNYSAMHDMSGRTTQGRMESAGLMFRAAEAIEDLANRKEVMPDDERPASGAPRRDTNPPQARKPGVTDGLTESDIVTVAEQALLYADHMAGEGVVFDDGKVCLDPSEFMLAFYDQIGRTETETGDAARLIAGELRRLYRAEASSATEIRRLRAVEAEQTARIAALEAGLRFTAYELNITRGYPHVGRRISIEAALTEADRLLPQEGR